MKKFLKFITPRFIKVYILEKKRLDALYDINDEFGFFPDIFAFDEDERMLYERMVSKLYRIDMLKRKYQYNWLPNDDDIY